MSLIERDDFDAALYENFREKVADNYSNLQPADFQIEKFVKENGIFLSTRVCPICSEQSDTAETLIHKTSFNVIRCEKCEMIYNNRIVSEEQFSRFLENNFSSETSIDLQENAAYGHLKRTKNKYILQEAGKITDGRSILDIGCHAGELLQVGNETGWETVGVEIDTGAAGYARSRGLNVLDFKFPDAHDSFSRKFSVVSLLDVLEHIADPLGFLKETKRLIEEGGVIVIQVPNFESLYVQLSVGENHNFCIDHVNSFTQDSLEAVTKLSGFKTLKIETFITELDLLNNFSKQSIHDKIRELRGNNINIPEPLTTQWLHDRFLGYKLFWIGRPV